ncbi:MAG: SDR family oxidoreductase [Alphaproteobacteria bacterium]|nr:SDR family oxidoreductase [Alphaproteobacteria bacterium]
MSDAATAAIAVTGASRGIGAAIAVALKQRGFTVGCLSRTGGPPPGEPDDGGYICAQCDVTDEASIREGLAAIADKAGGLKGLVNNAGFHRETRSRDLALDDYEQIMTTNATSVMLASREAYVHLKANGGGRIVNIGSFFDKIGVPRNLAYCASKAAVGAITRCLAAEWARDNIAVVDVAPGYIETDLNREAFQSEKFKTWLADRAPMRRPGTREEVARFVASLFSDDVPFLTGETIYLDGGQAMAI